MVGMKPHRRSYGSLCFEPDCQQARRERNDLRDNLETSQAENRALLERIAELGPKPNL